MTGSLEWKIQRIRRMGGGELIHRSLRTVKQFLEKKYVSLGWSPKPSFKVAAGSSLLPPLNDFLPEWQARYQLDTAGLNDLMQGNMTLFGHHKVKLGTRIDWRTDPDTGTRSPSVYGKSINYRNDANVGNIKVLWELGRQHHLVPLAAAYAVSGDDRYLEPIRIQLDSWIEENPFAIGVHWCSALELALRLSSWAIVHSLISARDGQHGLFGVVSDSEAFGVSIYQQAWFIRHYLSRHSSANNHLFGELCGLWIACNVFDLGTEGFRWKKKCACELEQQLQLQVFEDGVGKEQALYYHLWMLEYGIFIAAAGRRFGTPFSNEFSDRLDAMTDFIKDITPHGGTPPQIGDADDGFVTRFSASWPSDPYGDVVAAADVVLRAQAPRSLTEKAFWYGIIGMPDNGTLPTRTSAPPQRKYPRIYPNGGYAILGDDVCHIVFDAGSLGYLSIAAHGHADALSINLALSGKWWLVDPGTYVYHRMPQWRDYFRSTRAHNCVVVDGRDQSIMCGPFMWLDHAKAWIESQHDESPMRQCVKGSHDGYDLIGVRHRREVRVDVDIKEIVVIDELDGSGSHDIESWFQCAPDIEVKIQNSGNILTLSNSLCHQMITMHTDSALAWRVIRGQQKPVIAGWYSKQLDDKEPSPAICGSARLTLPARLETRMKYSLNVD